MEGPEENSDLSHEEDVPPPIPIQPSEPRGDSTGPSTLRLQGRYQIIQETECRSSGPHTVFPSRCFRPREYELASTPSRPWIPQTIPVSQFELNKVRLLHERLGAEWSGGFGGLPFQDAAFDWHDQTGPLRRVLHASSSLPRLGSRRSRSRSRSATSAEAPSGSGTTSSSSSFLRWARAFSRLCNHSDWAVLHRITDWSPLFVARIDRIAAEAEFAITQSSIPWELCVSRIRRGSFSLLVDCDCGLATCMLCSSIFALPR